VAAHAWAETNPKKPVAGKESRWRSCLRPRRVRAGSPIPAGSRAKAGHPCGTSALLPEWWQAGRRGARASDGPEADAGLRTIGTRQESEALICCTQKQGGQPVKSDNQPTQSRVLYCASRAPSQRAGNIRGIVTPWYRQGSPPTDPLAHNRTCDLLRSAFHPSRRHRPFSGLLAGRSSGRAPRGA
jgi:hypothetical protein